MRIRAGAEPLPSERLRTLSLLAADHGNGVIELTRRANLQLRGVRLDAMGELRAQLIALGFADASPERETRPALLVDPLSGIDDRCAHLDEIARAVDEALSDVAVTCTLSAKLGVVIDGGSGVLSGADADIRVEIDRGAPDLAHVSVGTPEGARPLGVCRASDAPASVAALVRELARFAGGRGDSLRMRELVHACGIAALQARVAALLVDPPSPLRRRAPTRTALGFDAGSRSWLGFGLPFGSAPHGSWTAIADLAEDFGDGELRLTPAREIVIGSVRPEMADALRRALLQLGMIVDGDDPRRHVVACAGAPACSSARGETRSLAVALAARVRPALASGAILHVSGCSKGCASSARAAMTVVLDEGGARVAVNADVADAHAAPIEPLETLERRLETMCAERNVRVQTEAR